VYKHKLKSILIKGFKSIDSDGQFIELSSITVLLGANGAGKSNLVSFFNMLNYMTTGALQKYVANQGFADSILYFGAKRTSEIVGHLVFQSSNAIDEYSFSLGRDVTGRLFFQDESIQYLLEGDDTPVIRELGGGAKESQLKTFLEEGDMICKVVQNILSQCRVYQFHDTSDTAKIRDIGNKDDTRYLRNNGGNLAAFLRSLLYRDKGKRYYDRIVRHIRQMIPQFGDFEIEPLAENSDYVRLNWREKDSDYLFGPHQLSDGSLRFIALTTLFMQPPSLLPNVIIVDEPELGLHPAAISALAGMVKAIASTTQVILATQSPQLVDEFSADQVVIVERCQNPSRSVFRKLDQETLAEWLERYSLSELWEKNVMGGRP
jgi:predicted ATPase